MLAETARTELRARIRDSATAQRPREVLSGVRELLSGTAKPGSDASFCLSAIKGVEDSLVRETGARRLRTYIVRSVTVEPMLAPLKVEAALAGLLLEVEVGGFGSFVDDLMNDAGALAVFKPELVVIVLEVEDLASGLPEMCAAGVGATVPAEIEAACVRLRQLLEALRRHSKARLVVQGFVVPDLSSAGDVADANLQWSLPRAVERLNNGVAEVCRSIADCVFFDVDRVAARFGRAGWRDARLFLATRLPVASSAFPAYASGLVRSAATLCRASRKVLCTDLDNTLWGGVLGEEGPGGIATGSVFPGNCYLEYQRYLKQLSARGILLAAVSKNNLPDVQEAFAQRSADLALGLNDFVATKISWGDKVVALRELAAELSLGLDSFVFVDDHPVECEAVRQQLPEVAVIQAPAEEPWRLVELLAAQPFFDSVSVTEDDRRRTEEYRAQAARAELAGSTGSREEFLGSLGIVCTFVPVAEAPLSRAVQLLGKTNQFNLTTRRHGTGEVEHFAQGGIAIAVRVRDRFGDAGVVGLALCRVEGELCTIDSLLLSCRVIGRGIESATLAEIAARAWSRGARHLLGEYRPTSKNSLCANFYPDQGFRSHVSEATDPASLLYELDLTTNAPETPGWLTLEGQEDHEFANSTRIAS